MSEICQELVYDAPGTRSVAMHRCGRKVKDDGMCGIHLAAKRRREANDAKREQADLKARERRVEAQRVCDRLEGRGIKAAPYYDWRSGSFTGAVVVSAADLEGLLDN